MTDEIIIRLSINGKEFSKEIEVLPNQSFVEAFEITVNEVRKDLFKKIIDDFRKSYA